MKESTDMTVIDPNIFKPEACANPISPNIFCANPTGVEYEGNETNEIVDLLQGFC